MRGPTPETFDQFTEQRPLRLAAKTEQQMRIFANHQVRVQDHLRAGGGQVVEGRHRRFELVAHAADLHCQGRWPFPGEAPAQKSDQRASPRRSAAATAARVERE
jgi:hypothetical protein